MFLTALLSAWLSFAEAPLPDLSVLPLKSEVADTLRVGDEPDADARQCLAGLSWKPGRFEVSCSKAANPKFDVFVRFASPLPSGDARNDVVVVEGSLAKDKAGQPVKARAVVVVHESGSGMTVGKLFASGLRDRGLHAFMVQMPFYGERRGERRRPEASQLGAVMRQAVADVRRTRDAVAQLPWVDDSHIGVQGTSLGGFVTANVGGLDRGYDSVFILLAGGNLHGMMQTGRREVAQFRRELTQAGVDDQQLKELLSVVEPTRIAHRFDPLRTWQYSALLDQVVPFENALALAEAGHLQDRHHIRMLADHYTGIVYLPLVLGHIAEQMKSDRP